MLLTYFDIVVGTNTDTFTPGWSSKSPNQLEERRDQWRTIAYR